MPLLSSDALVLRTYKVGETSKVVVLLTRERGKVRAVAKGARGGEAALSVGAGAAERGRVGLYGRQGPSCCGWGRASCCGRPSARGARAGRRPSHLSYFAELLDAFAQERRGGGRRCTGWRSRWCGRRRRDGDGRAGAIPGGVAAEAARAVPAARPLRRLRRAHRARERSTTTAQHRGFVCCAVPTGLRPDPARGREAVPASTSSARRRARSQAPCPTTRVRWRRSTRC